MESSLGELDSRLLGTTSLPGLGSQPNLSSKHRIQQELTTRRSKGPEQGESFPRKLASTHQQGERGSSAWEVLGSVVSTL